MGKNYSSELTAEQAVNSQQTRNSKVYLEVPPQIQNVMSELSLF